VQFRWYFRYPGPDGKFGRTRPELQDASEGNPLGLTALILIPKTICQFNINPPCEPDVDLTLKAQDVIHSFFVPAFG